MAITTTTTESVYYEGQWLTVTQIHTDYVYYSCGGGADMSSGGGATGAGHTGGGGGIPGGNPKGGNHELTFAPSAESSNRALLQQKLNKNPFGLLPCGTINHFYKIATFQPPTSVIKRLKKLDQQTNSNDFFTQSLQNAAGTVVNCDYFPVHISNMPIINGHKMTSSELMDYFRLHINHFINTNDGNFSPYHDEGINDTQLWNSSNPLGALVHIHIVPDDGTIVLSQINNTSFTVTTIHSPFDGYHPVSGNREWVITSNSDGSYTFYTSAVDRITGRLANFAQGVTGIPFKKADKLWKSLQNGMVKFITHHEGTASVGKTFIVRPNYDDVKAVINGKMTLDEFKKKLGC